MNATRRISVIRTREGIKEHARDENCVGTSLVYTANEYAQISRGSITCRPYDTMQQNCSVMQQSLCKTTSATKIVAAGAGGRDEFEARRRQYRACLRGSNVTELF